MPILKRNGKTFSGTPTKVDTAKSYTTFDSADDKNPTTWSEVELLASKEEQRSLFSKISTMFKNIRYLYKMLGTTDISQYSDGTVTGAIKSACDKADANEAAIADVNSNLSDVVTIISATLNSLTIAANGYGNMSQDISSFIPNGYKCIGACFASSGSSWFIPVSVYLIGTSVQVYVRNTYTGQDQGAPIINLICIRN